MAREIQRGANSVPHVQATLWQVQEMLPDLVLNKMKAPQKAYDVPEISPQQILEADGFIFVFPTRFGVMAAQFKAFFDATSDIWATQDLLGSLQEFSGPRVLMEVVKNEARKLFYSFGSRLQFLESY